MLPPSRGIRYRSRLAAAIAAAAVLSACGGTPPVREAPDAATVRTLLEAGPGGNVAVTRDHDDDPVLRARRLPAPRPVVMGTLVPLIQAMPRWHVADRNDDVIWAVRRTRLFRFRDDIYILCTETDDGETLVEVRSASRLGRSDLGQNRRNIAELWRALDRFLLRHHPPVRGTPPTIA